MSCSSFDDVAAIRGLRLSPRKVSDSLVLPDGPTSYLCYNPTNTPIGFAIRDEYRNSVRFQVTGDRDATVHSQNHEFNKAGQFIFHLGMPNSAAFIEAHSISLSNASSCYSDGQPLNLQQLYNSILPLPVFPQSYYKDGGNIPYQPPNHNFLPQYNEFGTTPKIAYSGSIESSASSCSSISTSSDSGSTLSSVQSNPTVSTAPAEPILENAPVRIHLSQIQKAFKSALRRSSCSSSPRFSEIHASPNKVDATTSPNNFTKSSFTLHAHIGQNECYTKLYNQSVSHVGLEGLNIPLPKHSAQHSDAIRSLDALDLGGFGHPAGLVMSGVDPDDTEKLICLNYYEKAKISPAPLIVVTPAHNEGGNDDISATSHVPMDWSRLFAARPRRFQWGMTGFVLKTSLVNNNAELRKVAEAVDAAAHRSGFPTGLAAQIPFGTFENPVQKNYGHSMKWTRGSQAPGVHQQFLASSLWNERARRELSARKTSKSVEPPKNKKPQKPETLIANEAVKKSSANTQVPTVCSVTPSAIILTKQSSPLVTSPSAGPNLNQDSEISHIEVGRYTNQIKVYKAKAEAITWDVPSAHKEDLEVLKVFIPNPSKGINAELDEKPSLSSYFHQNMRMVVYYPADDRQNMPSEVVASCALRRVALMQAKNSDNEARQKLQQKIENRKARAARKREKEEGKKSRKRI